jgi:hypothetical protein
MSNSVGSRIFPAVLFFLILSSGRRTTPFCHLKSIDVSEQHISSIFNVKKWFDQEISLIQAANSALSLPKRRLTFNGLHFVACQKKEVFSQSCLPWATAQHVDSTRSNILVSQSRLPTMPCLQTKIELLFFFYVSETELNTSRSFLESLFLYTEKNFIFSKKITSFEVELYIFF